MAKDPSKKQVLSNVLNIIFTGTVNLMVLLKPILVNTSVVVEKALNLTLNFDNLSKNWQGHKISDLSPLFARIIEK
ncbi:MAG: hypothetical protein MJ195_00670 [Mycoplasmoidaceae bacterium]|nr:hypothetical protein [Mycoplasmoidaceae bacterium]